MTIQIRPGTHSDVDGLWPAIVAAVAKMNAEGSDQWGEDYPTPDLYHGDVDGGNLLVAVDENDTPLGACCITLAHEDGYDVIAFQRGDPAGVIHRLVVNPMAQGGGIARQLCLTAEAVAEERGAHTMHVDTYSLNHQMQHLFASLGYEKRGDMILDYRPNPFPVFEKLL